MNMHIFMNTFGKWSIKLPEYAVGIVCVVGNILRPVCSHNETDAESERAAFNYATPYTI